MVKEATLRWVLLGTIALMLSPIWLTAWLPLVDFNNHIARCWILAHYDTDSFYRNFYTPVSGPLPYLVLDQSLIFFMSFVSPNIAAKLLASCVVVVHCIGCFWVARQFQTFSWITFLSMIFCFNSLFYMGFLSNAFAVAWFFLLIGVWATPREKWSAPQAIMCLVLGAIIYYSHLAGVFCIGLCALVFALSEWWQERRLYAGLGRFFIALLPALFLYPFAPKFGKVGAQIIFGGFERKIWAALMVFLGYNYAIDVMVLSGFAIAMFFILRQETEKFDQRLLLSAAALGACFVVFPWLLLSGSDADARLVLPACTLALLAVRLKNPFAWTKWRVLLVLSLTLKVCSLAWYWLAMGELADQQAILMRNMQEHSSMMPMIWSPSNGVEAKRERFLIGFAPAAVHLRNALVPTVFAVPGQHSIAVKKEFPAFSRQPLNVLHLGGNLMNQIEDRIDLGHLWEQYDYLYTYRAPEKLRRQLEAQAAQSWHAGHGSLYQSPQAHQRKSLTSLQQ